MGERGHHYLALHDREGSIGWDDCALSHHGFVCEWDHADAEIIANRIIPPPELSLCFVDKEKMPSGRNRLRFAVEGEHDRVIEFIDASLLQESNGAWGVIKFDGVNTRGMLRKDCPNPTGTPITLTIRLRAEKPTGVVFAHGGGAQGYALCLKEGCPIFSIRSDRKRTDAVAPDPIGSGWVTLTGQLTDDARVRLFVDQSLVAEQPARALIKKMPVEKLDIGFDAKADVYPIGADDCFGGEIDYLELRYDALPITRP
jgi:hypothetical protein